MEKLRILIGSSICQKPRLLEKFLGSIQRIAVSDLDISFLFIDDNQEEKSSDLLHEAALGRSKLVLHAPPRETIYRTDEIKHYWDDSLVLRVANLKNEIINYAIDNEFDYLFLIDSDLLIHPNLIEHLVAQKKDVISEIFWTAWQPGMMPLPNVWMYDNYEMAHPSLSDEERTAKTLEFLTRLGQPGTYEVGGLGACTLLAVSALKRGLNFSPVKNVSFWGEDRWFCIRAAALGIKLFVDTHFPAKHLYRESDVDASDEFA